MASGLKAVSPASVPQPVFRIAKGIYHPLVTLKYHLQDNVPVEFCTFEKRAILYSRHLLADKVGRDTAAR